MMRLLSARCKCSLLHCICISNAVHVRIIVCAYAFEFDPAYVYV